MAGVAVLEDTGERRYPENGEQYIYTGQGHGMTAVGFCSEQIHHILRFGRPEDFIILKRPVFKGWRRKKQ